MICEDGLEKRGCDDAIGEEVVMETRWRRRDSEEAGAGHGGDDATVRRWGRESRDVEETIQCDTWARRVQLLLSHHDTCNSDLSGCVEVNFSLP